MTPSLVLLGNLLVDDLVFADGRTRMAQPGGAILYGALGATLWGARPGLVSLLGEDYPHETLDRLQARGADLAGVHALGGRGVRTWLLYEGSQRRMIHRLGCPSHAEVSPQPVHIPAAWHAASSFHLAPMPFDVQRTLVRSLGGHPARFVSIDPHLPITEQTLDDWRSVLADVDAFFPGDDELLLDGAQRDPRSALRRLAGGRLRFVVFTRGASGGLLYDARDDRFQGWTSRAETVMDPTGAGDAFAAAFVCAHLEGCAVEKCLRRAVVAAGFAIEAWGPEALFAATPADAAARLRRWFDQDASR